MFRRLLNWGRASGGDSAATTTAQREPARTTDVKTAATRARTASTGGESDLRRVAILIATLDAETATRLLAEMPAEMAQRVRGLARQIKDVPASERDAILRQFLARRRGGSTNGPSPPASRRDHERTGVDLELSPVARTAARDYNLNKQASSTAGRSHEDDASDGEAKTPQTPFELLTNLPDSDLGGLLIDEPTQVIALLCERLPAERAGRLLARLSAAVREDVLDRFERYDTEPSGLTDELADEIAASLWDKHERTLTARRRRDQAATLRRATVEAETTDSTPASTKTPMNDPGRAAAVETPTTPGVEQTPTPRMPAVVPTPAGTYSPPGRSHSPSGRPSEESVAVSASPHAGAVAAERPGRREVTRRDVTLTFADVAELNNPAWSVLFETVQPEVIRVALAGAEPALVERLTGRLERVERAVFMERLAAVYPVRLAEIDAAQRHLAEVASELLILGRISDLPTGDVLRRQGRFYGKIPDRTEGTERPTSTSRVRLGAVPSTAEDTMDADEPSPTILPFPGVSSRIPHLSMSRPDAAGTDRTRTAARRFALMTPSAA